MKTSHIEVGQSHQKSRVFAPQGGFGDFYSPIFGPKWEIFSRIFPAKGFSTVSLGACLPKQKKRREIMFFIPYSRIQIESKLKVDELEHRLKDQLEPHSIVSGMLRGNHKYFQGSIENREFKISRIIHYRNSFRPVITGKFQSEIDRTLVELTLRLDYVVLAVMLLIIFGFFGNIILPIFSFLFQSFLFGESVDFVQYLPEGYWLKFVLSSTGMFLFFYLFIMIPFNIEAGKAIKYLDELFENQLNRENNPS